MSFEVWLAFVVASSILTLIPGPCVLLVLSQALTKGISSAFLCIVGDIVGSAVLMILSLIGVGAILATSATLFVIFKWLGIAYMAYLGVCQLIEAKNSKLESGVNETTLSSISSFNSGFFASLLNPKAIIFYMAFLPQFIDPNRDALLQFSILVITSSIVIAVILAGYAFLGSRTRKLFFSEKSRKYFNYSGASFLIGSSVFMASASK